MTPTFVQAPTGRRGAAPLVAMLAALVFTAGWLIAGFREWVAQPTDITGDYISSLGARTAESAWLWNGASVIAGALIAVLAVLAMRTWWAQQTARVATVALLVVGVGTIADGLLPLDCALPSDEVCAARNAAGDVSSAHAAHMIETTITVVAMIVAAAALAIGLRREQPRLAPALATLAVALVVLVALTLALESSGLAGIAQRFMALAFAALLVVFGHAVGTSSAAGDRPSPQQAAPVAAGIPTA